MKLLAGAASILALTLFLSPVMAEDNAVVVDQPAAEQPAAAQPATEIPAEILALLSDSRPASELTDEELLARAKAARRFAKDEKLPDDIRSQLVAMFEASRAEMETRKQAAKKPEQPAQPEQQAEPAPAPQPEQQAAPAEPAPAPAVEQAIPEEVANLLNDGRALADIDAEELKTRAKAARRFAKNDNLPQDVRDKLNAIAQDARIELTKRETQTQQQAEPAPAPEVPKEQPAIVQEAPPVTEVPQAIAVEPAPPPPPAKADVQALDNNAGNPEAEKQARLYLDDTTPLENLSDGDLRTRLDSIRDVMASNELSPETERAVRKRYLSTPDQQTSRHRQLAHYFDDRWNRPDSP